MCSGEVVDITRMEGLIRKYHIPQSSTTETLWVQMTYHILPIIASQRCMKDSMSSSAIEGTLTSDMLTCLNLELRDKCKLRTMSAQQPK